MKDQKRVSLGKIASRVRSRSRLSKLAIYSVGLLVTGYLLSTGYTSAFGCSGGGDLNITSATTWTTNQCVNNVVVSNGATLTISGNTVHEMTSLTLGTGSSAGQRGYISVQSDTGTGKGVELKANAVTIMNSSSISADGTGFAAQQGPGGSATGGASHAAAGLDGSAVVYGNVTQPETLGSGGKGGAGGGAIKISVNGNFSNNGNVSANGVNNATGAGSGGSVWVNFTNGGILSGAGGLQANGGNGSNSLNVAGENAASGGRVAVTGYASTAATGQSIAQGGDSGGTYDAPPGTVVTKLQSQAVGTLLINNYSSWIPRSGYFTPILNTYPYFDTYSITNQSRAKFGVGAEFILPSGSNILANGAEILIDDGGKLTASSGATLTLGGYSTLNIGNTGNLTLASGAAFSMGRYDVLNNIGTGTFNSSAMSTIEFGGTFNTDHTATNSFATNTTINTYGIITHPANTNIKSHWLDLTFTNLSIVSNGAIVADGKGFAAQQGPGGSSSGGASHAGVGSNGSTTVYGSVVAPVDLGSGGKTTAGGGAIKISLTGNLNVDASGGIRADGAYPTCGTAQGTGAGGSVWISFSGGGTWSGGGSITANAGQAISGACMAGGGGGSGGRVMVSGYGTDTHSGAVSATTPGGTDVMGETGTVVHKSSTQATGTLRVYGSWGIQAPTRIYNTYPIFDKYEIMYGSVEFGAGADFALPSGATIDMQYGSVLGITTGSKLSIQSGATLSMNSSNSTESTWPVLNITNNTNLTINNGAVINWNYRAIINNIGTGTFDTSSMSSLVIGGRYVTNYTASNLFSDNVVVNAMITHPANSSAKTYWLDLNFKNLDITSSGYIDVSGKGYAVGQGPGGSISGGASHAGAGMNGSSVVYGSMTAPVDLGSGGKNTAGGGAIKLSISGNLTGSGFIKANALDPSCGVSQGAGSGGSIWINFTNNGNYSGTGQIDASGGDATLSCSGSTGGGGSGGRVMISGYNASTFVVPYVNMAGYSDAAMLAGATGTVVSKASTEAAGQLKITGGSSNTNLPVKILSSDPLFDKYLTEGAVVEVASNADFTLPNGKLFSVESNTSGGGRVSVGTGRKFTVNSGAALEVRGMAYGWSNEYKVISQFDVNNLSTLKIDGGGFLNSEYLGQINNVGTGTFDTSSMSALFISGILNTNHTATNSFPANVTVSGYMAAITHPVNGSTQTNWLDLQFNNLTIDNSGSIDVNSKGHAGGTAGQNGFGPGAGGGSIVATGGGGGYGGTGISGTGGSGGATYGDRYDPSFVGSGGGGGFAAGGTGGGYIRLNVANTLTVSNGNIYANGGNGSSHATRSAGGGSGGSVNIKAATFNCSGGGVYANGGSGGDGGASNPDGGTGGGGRIAYEVGAYTPCNTMEVNGPNPGTIEALTSRPIEFAFVSSGEGTVTWQWKDNSIDESEFRVFTSDGTQVGVVASSTVSGKGSVYSFVETGLTPNVSYTRKAAAYGDGLSAYSNEASGTTKAQSPLIGANAVISETQLSFTLNMRQNSAPTQVALKEEVSGKYLQSNGSLDTDPVWRTSAQWSSPGMVGLSKNTRYELKAKARNSENIETGLSSGASKFTLAAAPVNIASSDTSETSVKLTYGNSSNPQYTEFTIVDQTSGKYIQQNGSMGTTPNWQVYSGWGAENGVVVTGLEEDTAYSFAVRARNGDGVETASNILGVDTTPDEEEPGEEPPEEPEPETPEEPETPVVPSQPEGNVPTAPKTGGVVMVAIIVVTVLATVSLATLTEVTYKKRRLKSEK